MDLEGGIQGRCSGFQDLGCPSVVRVLRGREGDPAVAVLGVVPAEKRAAEGLGIRQRT